MLKLARDFVLELAAKSGLTPPPCAGGVATLDHEVPDDAVKLGCRWV